MLFKSFSVFLFAVSTILSSNIDAKTKEVRQTIGDRVTPVTQTADRQPIGERSAPIQQDVRQPIGAREEEPSKAKSSKKKKDRKSKKKQQTIVADVRQPIGTREECATPKRAPQPAVRQVIGERAAPVQRVEVRQPIGTRAMPVVTPQRIERPVQPATATIQFTQRPIIRTRALPPVILLDCRTESYSSAALSPHLISRKGDIIQLNDGSSWKVRHRDQKDVRRWSQEDLIVIETGQYFTWSVYKLVNYSRHESCDVELIAPVRNGFLSHWITEINPFDGYLRLQDGSIWRMNASELMSWNVNDEVIIGLSKDLFSNHYTYILINPRAKKRLLATFSLSF